VRQRAISAAILVPVLLVVLALGGIVLAAAVAVITALAAREVRCRALRCLVRCAHRAFLSSSVSSLNGRAGAAVPCFGARPAAAKRATHRTARLG